MVNLDTNERVDWFRVISGLERNGYPLMKIAKETEIPKGTIHGWKMETGRPTFERAIKLIALWCVVLEKSPAEIPTQNIYRPTELIRRNKMLDDLFSLYLRYKAEKRAEQGN